MNMSITAYKCICGEIFETHDELVNHTKKCKIHNEIINGIDEFKKEHNFKDIVNSCGTCKYRVFRDNGYYCTLLYDKIWENKKYKNIIQKIRKLKYDIIYKLLQIDSLTKCKHYKHF